MRQPGLVGQLAEDGPGYGKTLNPKDTATWQCAGVRKRRPRLALPSRPKCYQVFIKKKATKWRHVISGCT